MYKMQFYLHKWLKIKKSLSRPCSRVSGKLCTKCCISYIKRTLDLTGLGLSKLYSEKLIGKFDFSRFWQDLGFGACFFSIKILIKKKQLENWIFRAFGKILVLVDACYT